MKMYNKEELQELMKLKPQTANNWINKIGNGVVISEKEIIDYIVNMSERRIDVKINHIETLIERGLVKKISDNPKTLYTDYHSVPIIPLKKYGILSLIYAIDKVSESEEGKAKRIIDNVIFSNDVDVKNYIISTIKGVDEDIRYPYYFITNMFLNNCTSGAIPLLRKEEIDIIGEEKAIEIYIKSEIEKEKRREEQRKIFEDMEFYNKMRFDKEIEYNQEEIKLNTNNEKGESKMEYKKYMTGKEIVEFLKQELLPNECYNAEFLMYNIDKFYTKVKSMRRKDIFPYLYTPTGNGDYGEIYKFSLKDKENIFEDFYDHLKSTNIDKMLNKEFKSDKYVREKIFMPLLFLTGIYERYVYFVKVGDSDDIIERHIVDIVPNNNIRYSPNKNLFIVSNHIIDLIKVVE